MAGGSPSPTPASAALAPTPEQAAAALALAPLVVAPASITPERLDAIAVQLRADLAKAAQAKPSEPEAKYMSLSRYARTRGLSRKVVRGWIEDGLPHTNAPGHLRIIVKEADAWIEKGPGQGTAPRAAAQPAGGAS
jgi:hypothetical protein